MHIPHLGVAAVFAKLPDDEESAYFAMVDKKSQVSAPVRKSFAGLEVNAGFMSEELKS